MRVAIVTESFLPTVNGVSNSVARVTDELTTAGHDVLIVAPGRGPEKYAEDVDVVRTPAVPLPRYGAIPIGVATTSTYTDLETFRPDVVHVGGPVILGAWGLAAARRLGVPSVALYQTDFPRYVRQYYKVGASEAVAWRWLKHFHSMAEVTLAPSSAAAWDIRRHGIPRVEIWGRGVDIERFNPAHRDEKLRAELSPDGQVIVGYVGRLAIEKNVGMLKALRRLNNIQLVIVGDGPERERLEKQVPKAVFAGYQGGDELGRYYASLDIFVHTGAHETFCQTIQEAYASGVPVVGPAVGGPLDLIRHGVTGFLYRPDDPRSFRRAVNNLANDEERRTAIGQYVRPKVESRTWAALTAELVEHYKQAIERYRDREGHRDRDLLRIS